MSWKTAHFIIFYSSLYCSCISLETGRAVARWSSLSTCSWNFSQAEKSFYISNSIKLNSKALISVFSTTLLLTMGLFPGANPTTSTSNTLSQAAGQHDLSGSSCKPSLSISLISAVSIWLEHPFVSSRIPPLCWATVCAVGQSWELMQPKSKHVFHSLLAWLSWV